MLRFAITANIPVFNFQAAPAGALLNLSEGRMAAQSRGQNILGQTAVVVGAPRRAKARTGRDLRQVHVIVPMVPLRFDRRVAVPSLRRSVD